MGLKPSAGPTPKAVLKEKFHDAFRTYESLSAARDAVGGQRATTVVLMDCAVTCMAVPQAVKAFTHYATVVWRSVRDCMGAGKLVIITFDEPEVMTNAKRLEQARRDATKRKRKVVQCSADLTSFIAPPSPHFTRADLHACNDVHSLKDHRPCKARLFDEIAIFVLKEATQAVARWKVNGHDAGALILDGVDVRGAERAPGDPRQPQMVGTDAELVALLARKQPIGEGDLKLSQLERRVRELVAAGQEREAGDAKEPSESLAAVEAAKLIQHNTIDTDSFAIGVIDVAKRRVAPLQGSVHSLLCMRERSSKDAWSDEQSSSTYTTVDIALLESMLQQHMWGLSRSPNPVELLGSALAFVAGAAICGCDFVELRGTNFPHVMDALPVFVKTESRACDLLTKALQPDANDALQSTRAVRTLCLNISEILAATPRYTRQAGLVREVEEDVLRKTAWLLAYWAGRERVADETWGYLSTPSDGVTAS